MAFFIGNSFCRLCQTSEGQLVDELVDCSKGLLAKGPSFPANALQSARLPGSNMIWMLRADAERGQAFKIDIGNLGPVSGHDKNEILLHTRIYDLRPDVNAICHTKNPYTVYATLDGPLEKVHGEAALILGDIPIIENDSSGRDDYKLIESVAKASVGEPLRPIRTIIIRKRDVLGLGACIHEARAFVEILEEWAMFKMFAKMHGSSLSVLTLEQLRSLGARYARSIKFGGRQSVR